MVPVYRRTGRALLVVALFREGGCGATPVTSVVPINNSNGVRPASNNPSVSFTYSYPIDQSWYGNFTVGAAHNQQLHIVLAAESITLFPSMYSPSSESKDLHRNTTYPQHTEGFPYPYKFVCEDYTDVLGIPGISVANASFEIIKKIIKGSSLIHRFAGGLGLSPDSNGYPPFVLRGLCTAGLAQCRLGVTLDNNQTGKLVFGEAASSLYEDNLVTSPIAFQGIGSWVTHGNIASKGKVYSTNALLALDIDTTDIMGPSDLVQEVFQDQHIDIVFTPQKLYFGGTTKVARGRFPCDQPPSLGFDFGGTTFYISSSAMIGERLGNNQCLSILGGSDQLTPYPGGFSLGSPFFEGHYVDFNLDNQTIGFANLKAASAAAGNAAAVAKSSMLKAALIAFGLTVPLVI